MRRNVLITGSATILGSHLAALRLTSSGDKVFYAAEESDGPTREELSSLVGHAARKVARAEEAGDVDKLLDERLAWIPLKLADGNQPRTDSLPEDVSFDEVWFLSGGAYSVSQPAATHDAASAHGLLALLPTLGATEFNYVSVDGGTSDGRPDDPAGATTDESAGPSRDVEREVVERCEASGVGHRIFQVSRVVADIPPSSVQSHEGFLGFLAALHNFKGEVEERVPEYFEYQALRCLAPAGATLNLISADRAAELISRIAARRDTLGGTYRVAAPEDISFADLCARVGTVYDLSLLAVEDAAEMNAVDRLFQTRWGGLQTSHASRQNLAIDETYRLAGLAPDRARLGEEAQTELLRAARRNQDAARAERMESFAALPASLERKVMDRGGSELIYYSLGTGETPFVLLNALGQGLHYWHRLMERLSRRHRVIIWEPGGTDESSQTFRLAEQVDDLADVLENEDVSSCYLVGWCTGPKVALEFYQRRPEAVEGMVFLNGTFKCPGVSKELETAYEHHLEQLCRTLDRRPALATSLMSSLRASVTGESLDLLDESDRERLAADVLSTMNVDLREDVLHPFRSEAVFVNYARQLLDFWSSDSLADAGSVQAPVLLVASEYDKIAGADMSREAARHFPRARLVELQGATHYCLYDSPELICELIESFVQNLDGPREGEAS